MKSSIDLNADLGEDETQKGIARDLKMMRIVSSCNIACGGHAGSAENISRMLKAAKNESVAAGAHPSYPDRKNFGRVSMEIEPAALQKSLEQQTQLIADIASDSGTRLTHLKPHGALYNDAQDDEILSNLLCRLAKYYGLTLVGMGSSTMESIAKKSSIDFISEAFIDRRYLSNGRLTPRSFEGAVIADEQARLDQGLALACGDNITDNLDQQISVSAQTLCLHSDSEGALKTADSMRVLLESKGITIKAPFQ